MKKTFFSLLTAVVFAVLLSISAFAVGDTVFLGFDDDELPSGLKPNFKYEIENGILSATDLTTTDPYLTYICNINADDYESVVVRIKHELTAREDNGNPNCQVFYKGVSAAGNELALSGSNSVTTALGGLSTEGEYVTYTIPLNKSNLSGAKINTFRFDVVNCPGSFDIDYIMLVPKNIAEDMVYNFNTDGDSEGWGYANLAAKYTISDGTLNGTSASNKTNGLFSKTFTTAFAGADYNKAYTRMKLSGLSADAKALFYTNLVDEEGSELKPWSSSYGGYKNTTVSVSTSNNDKFVVYGFDFGQYDVYKNNYITKMYYNFVNKAGVSVNVDYILFKHSDNFTWKFDYAGCPEGWTLPSGFSVSEDGKLVYKGGSSYSNPNTRLTGLSIDADDYDAIEVVMKHNLKPNAEGEETDETSNIQFYYEGVNLAGETFTASESNSVKTAISQTSGDNYKYYYLDLTKAKNWKGSTISTIRYDILNSNGEAYVEYLRLVPSKTIGKNPIDAEDVTLEYEFEDDIPGTADGTLTLDIGEQNFADIKKAVIYWGEENDGTYSALEGYTAISSYGEGAFDGTFSIDKGLLIPDDATAIIVEITDIDKKFIVARDIPEDKLPDNSETPLYTAAFISDIHIGTSGSETAPSARLVAAKDQINELADFVVINGDLTQWYGAYSGEEFKIYNFNGTSYGDNGETDTSYLEQKLGVSQWEILTDYFESFNVPVYPVQGNHDIKDSDTRWNEVYYQPEYWLDTFHGWLDYSNTTNTAHKYENPVSYSITNNYYDTEINGHHYIFLEMPKMEGDHYAFGEEQLAWLDKKLYENEGTGKPTFVFTHVPTDSNMNGGTSGSQILDNDEFLAVLDKHPTAVVVSGHTHYTLDTEFYSSVDGGQESVSMIHDGGSSLVDVLENGVVNEYPGSHGVIVEIYSDKILIKGRNFMEDKWISKAYTALSMKETLEADVTLVKDVSDDGTASIYLKGDCSSFNCTYIVDGEESLVITDDTDYVAVRIEDSEGLFTTLFYDDVNLIAPDFEAPSVIEGQDIRFDNTDEGAECSVRFKASVTASQQSEASEYGFIVTRKSFLDKMAEKAASGEDVETELTFDFSYNGTDLFAYGPAYLVDENGEASINKFTEIGDNGDIIFAAVLMGIKNNDSVHVNEVFSVRPYIRISDGNNEHIFYGECSSASLADAVKTVDTSDLPDSYKKIIEDIIALGA